MSTPKETTVLYSATHDPQEGVISFTGTSSVGGISITTTIPIDAFNTGSLTIVKAMAAELPRSIAEGLHALAGEPE
jgi:hypothetical protein